MPKIPLEMGDGDSTTLNTACTVDTVYTVDTLDTVDTLETVDMVYTVNMVYTVDTVKYYSNCFTLLQQLALLCLHLHYS